MPPRHRVFCIDQFVFIALFGVSRAALRQSKLPSYRESVCVSDGTLLSAQKCGKSVKGTPLKIPVVYGGLELARLICFRHTLEENILRLPRSHATAFLFDEFCLCFGVPVSGAGTYKSLQSKALHSKGRRLQQTTAGASERGKRFAVSSFFVLLIDFKQIIGFRGFLRGFPLDGVLVTLPPRAKLPAGGLNGLSMR